METNKQKVIQGWDVYSHLYEYDETKIIAMLHKNLIDQDLYPDWETICQVSHQIYNIYLDELEHGPAVQDEYPIWMGIFGREEEGYIQAWFSRTVCDWIKYYKNKLKGE